MEPDPNTSLSHLQWRSTEYILALGPLTPQTALDYFSHSPFFSKVSNNAVLRMQMIFSRGGMEGVDEESELRRFVGIEYSLVHSAPPELFIIHKRDRKSPTETIPLAAYYILNSSIYQGPTLYHVLNERLLTSLYSLSSSLELLKSHKPKFTVESQGKWDIKPDPITTLPTAINSESIVESKTEGEVVVEEMGIEDEIRPGETFNPLLFRAIQSASTTLSTPPPIPILQPVIPAVENSVEKIELKEVVEKVGLIEKEKKEGSNLGKRKKVGT